MLKPIIAVFAAAGLASPALAAAGLVPDAHSWAMLGAGGVMISLIAGGRRRRTGRVAD